MKLVKITKEANAYTTCPLDEAHNEPFFAAMEANDPEEMNEEDKEMSTKTNTKKNVKANVKINKEENKMTKQNMNDFRAMLTAQLEAEHEGVTFNPTTKAPEKWAQYNNLGMTVMTVKNIEYVTRKFNGDPDVGKATRFVRAIKAEFVEAEVPIFVNDTMFLYEGDTKVDIDIYDSITNPSGNIGYYMTIKEAALEKKVEELDPNEDIEVHVLKEGQRIWRPATKEFAALRNAYKVSEFEFDGNTIVLPEDAKKIAVYVYEDVVKDKVLKNVDGKIKKFQTFQYFYNASFIKPEDVHDMKYGRRFTTSEDSNRRAEIASLPGVQAYLENC